MSELRIYFVLVFCMLTMHSLQMCTHSVATAAHRHGCEDSP